MTQLGTSEKSYMIDQDAGTITFVLDHDTGERETATISELVEMLFWLRSRQDDLRFHLQRVYPKEVKKLMHRVGNYYKGVCEDRSRVKITAERWHEVRSQIEKRVRSNWLFDINDKKAGVLEVQMLDNAGQPIFNPNKPEQYSESDCPEYLVNQELQKLLDPAWWLLRGDNLDTGRFVKTP